MLQYKITYKSNGKIEELNYHTKKEQVNAYLLILNGELVNNTHNISELKTFHIYKNGIEKETTGIINKFLNK